MAHVFVSYSRKDKEFVTELIDYCEGQGIEFWRDVDNLHGGDAWMHELHKNIANAYAIIVIWSPDSRQSEYVAYECAYALGQGKQIIPITLAQTELFQPFAVIHALDFKDGRREWKKLIHDLNTARERYTEKIVAPDNAPPALRDAVKALNSDASEQDHLATLLKIKQMLPEHRDIIGEILAQTLTHAHPRVAMDAARMLVESNADYARLSALITSDARLQTLLRLHHEKRNNLILCQRICSVISNIGSSRLLRPLTATFATKPPADIQGAIVTALGKIASAQEASERAVAELGNILHSLHDRGAVYTATVNALRRINSDAARRVLADAGL
jgi:hypothetical protein